MNTRYAAYFLLWLLLCVAAVPVRAENAPASTPYLPPAQFVGYYQFNWQGIPVGNALFELREQKDYHFRSRFLSEAGGVVKLFKSHKGDTRATGRRTSAGYMPALYETRYHVGKKHTSVRLQFDSERNIVKEDIIPTVNHKARPEIPNSLKRNVFDLITALLQVRHLVYEGYLTGKKEFSLEFFDGMRLARLHINLVEDLLLKMPDGSHRPALRVTLKRTPLGGFKDKELKEMAKGEPLVHLYFSKDERMIPLKIALDVLYGQLRGILREECQSLEQCQQKQ